MLTNTAKSVTSSVQPLRLHLCHTEQHHVLNRDGEGTISQSGLDFERVLVRESPRTSLLSVTTIPTTCGRVRGIRSRSPQRSLACPPPPHPPRSLEKGVRRSSKLARHVFWNQQDYPSRPSPEGTEVCSRLILISGKFPVRISEGQTQLLQQ